MKNHRLMWVEETAVITENTETGVFLTGHAVPVEPDLDHSIPVKLVMSLAPEWERNPYVITLHSKYPPNSLLKRDGELWLIGGESETTTESRSEQ